MSRPDHDLLKPLLEPARAALRGLDGDQVPHDLRAVARYGGGSLPPPLAAALVRGLEQYEWLREKTAEHLGGGTPGGGRREAAALFLERPEGWEERLEEIAAAEEGRAAQRAAEEMHRRNRALESELQEARSRSREARRADERRIRELEEKVSALSSALRSERAAEARGEAGVRQAAAEAREAAEAYRRERDAALEEAAGMREQLREERRRRRRAEEAAEESRETGAWVADDPEELAERLDLVALMARPPAAARRPADAGGEPEALVLPAGTAPDSAEAVDWLIRSGASATVIVDGYNAGFLLAGETNPAAARERLGPILDRLARLSGGQVRVVAVYDSGLAPAEAPPAGGVVSIRFTGAGRTADEEIVEMAGGFSGPVVVVSGDREVRDGAEAAGAIPLWSSALVAWARRR